MASTRQVHIYQDPDHTPVLPTNACLGRPVSSAEASLIDVSGKKDIVLDPPPASSNGRSPYKFNRPSNTSPTRPVFGDRMNIVLPAPQPPKFTTDSPAKRSALSIYHPIAPQKPNKAMVPTFPTAKLADKENHLPYPGDNSTEFPEPPYNHKIQVQAPGSRDHSDKKRRLSDGRSEVLPAPENMPLVGDNGGKPPYSYATLIGMAILRAPSRRLTLAQIYSWISNTFAFYDPTQTGWQNSIRHNLSLNSKFIKQERPKDDPGKGNYWAIKPGEETQFFKDKPTRRPASSSGLSMKPCSLLSSESNVSLYPAPALSAYRALPQPSDAFDPSSDATIPASDAPSQEDDQENIMRMPPPSLRLPISSPIQAIQSSPPVAPKPLFNDGSPSVPALYLPTNHSILQKRKLTDMDDSGYFSSLESSATRPQLPVSAMTQGNESGRRRSTRGRAEDEIARMRSSSHDISPTKSRSLIRQSTPQLVSSSPFRHFEDSLVLPPLTPAMTFKLPPKPPASTSPNTNLRNHRNKIRDLVGSPIKNANLVHDEVSFSPAFNIVDDEHYSLLSPGFSVFADVNRAGSSRYSSASPGRRSGRRPRTDRINKTSSILADITGANLNSKTLLRAPYLDSPIRRGSPPKTTGLDENTTGDDKEELFGLKYLDEEDVDEFSGLDLLQGFQKIGGQKNTIFSAKKPARPSLGSRSHTSRL